MSQFVPGSHPLWFAFAYGVAAGTLGWGLLWVGMFWREYVAEFKRAMEGFKPEPRYKPRHGRAGQDPVPTVSHMYGGLSLVKDPDEKDRTVELPRLPKVG